MSDTPAPPRSADAPREAAPTAEPPPNEATPVSAPKASESAPREVAQPAPSVGPEVAPSVVALPADSAAPESAASESAKPSAPRDVAPPESPALADAPTANEAPVAAIAEPPIYARVPRWARWAGLGVAALSVLVVLGLVLRRTVVLSAVKREARALGIEIDDVDDIDVGLREVVLRGVHFRLDGVQKVTGTIDEARAPASTPLTRLDAEGMTIAIEGAFAARIAELEKWSRAHPAAFAIALHARGAHAEWRSAPDAAPWLDARGGTAATSSQGFSIDATEATLISLGVGPVHAVWFKDGSRATVDRPASHASGAPLHVDVRPGDGATSLDATFGPAPLGDLATRLHATKNASLAGKAQLTLRVAGGFEGNASAVVDGWVPPHEHELDGILFGKTTRASATFRSADGGGVITLEDATAEAGALKLHGKGELDGLSGAPHAKLDLRGSVPCSVAVKSAAANLGPLAAFAGIASRGVEGNVAVDVHVDGALRDPATWKPKPSVRPNCQFL